MTYGRRELRADVVRCLVWTAVCPALPFAVFIVQAVLSRFGWTIKFGGLTGGDLNLQDWKLYLNVSLWMAVFFGQIAALSTLAFRLFTTRWRRVFLGAVSYLIAFVPLAYIGMRILSQNSYGGADRWIEWVSALGMLGMASSINTIVAFIALQYLETRLAEAGSPAYNSET
jgi:hypothetical protein